MLVDGYILAIKVKRIDIGWCLF